MADKTTAGCDVMNNGVVGIKMGHDEAFKANFAAYKPGISREECIEHYNKNVETYEEVSVSKYNSAYFPMALSYQNRHGQCESVVFMEGSGVDQCDKASTSKGTDFMKCIPHTELANLE